MTRRSSSKEEGDRFPFSTEDFIAPRAYQNSCNLRKEENNEMEIIKLFHKSIQLIDIRDLKFSTNFLLKSRKEVNTLLINLGLRT